MCECVHVHKYMDEDLMCEDVRCMVCVSAVKKKHACSVRAQDRT